MTFQLIGIRFLPLQHGSSPRIQCLSVRCRSRMPSSLFRPEYGRYAHEWQHPVIGRYGLRFLYPLRWPQCRRKGDHVIDLQALSDRDPHHAPTGHPPAPARTARIVLVDDATHSFTIASGRKPSVLALLCDQFDVAGERKLRSLWRNSHRRDIIQIQNRRCRTCTHPTRKPRRFTDASRPCGSSLFIFTLICQQTSPAPKGTCL